MRKNRIYFVEAINGWFCIETNTKRNARQAGVNEFGKGMMLTVRIATESELGYFISQKGSRAIKG